MPSTIYRLTIPSLVLVVCGLVSTESQAQVGFRQLQSVHPVAVQRGTRAIVNVRSNFTLDGTHAVFFDRPGVRMTYAETAPREAPHKGRGTAGAPFRFEVDVPEGQEPRVYEFRVATDQAVSSVSHLLVTDYPVVEEAEGENGTLSAAQSVAIPSAICGVCDKPEDVDCFRFRGEAGSQVTLQVYAQRVTHAIHDMVNRTNYLMDPLLTLYGPHGQVLAQSDNFFGGDSFLHTSLPETGEYVFEVRDARYLGDPRYEYCVELTDRPWAQTVFPLAVQRGHSAQAEIVGLNLGESRPVTISAAADEPIGWKTRRFDTARGETNPVPLLVSEHCEISASADIRSAATAQRLELPVGVSGRFNTPDETHFYAFNATKGTYYSFKVEAHRLRLPVDCLLEILDAHGKQLAEADDSADSKDTELGFRAPADGQYVLSVRDLHGRSGPACLYRLQAEVAAPDFAISGEYYYAMLSPGMHTIWFVALERRNGFDGPVEMQVEGLPDGVSLVPVTIPTGMNSCALILSASRDAAIDARLVRVCGTARGDDGSGALRMVTRLGRVHCEVQGAGGNQMRWPIGTQIVGVVKPMDLVRVEAQPTELVIRPGEKAELKVRVERSGGFTGAVMLDLASSLLGTKLGDQLPPGVTVSKESQLRLTGDTLEGKIVLQASSKALPVERLPIAAIASVSISFSVSTRYASNPVYLTISKDVKEKPSGP